ncbi:hypothetical protein SCALIN_C05_0262 [Candidatus Scalindua japonica]|uniref:Uncharacterized protein n=1 Tax=Candidatus Scalindua japonica TaxID=1284222 RepID=A0A286TWC4_9BACT|nr:hypothetical protein SCALIN_C05_0262 [Candidatus Scalindua japonica]
MKKIFASSAFRASLCGGSKGKNFFHNFSLFQTLGIFEFYDKKMVVFSGYLFYHVPSYKILT